MHAACLQCSDSATTRKSYCSSTLNSVARSGEAVPQQPVGSLHTPLSHDETYGDKSEPNLNEEAGDEAGNGRPKPMLQVADDVKSPAMINSMCDKEDQPTDNAAAAVAANTVICERGNMKQTCSASGCQQQCCRDCALDATDHQYDDFIFCSDDYCCGETMYCGDHNHLFKACCQCDAFMCDEDTQWCPCCEETLCERCSNLGTHESECRAGQWDGHTISNSDKAFLAEQLWQEGLLDEIL